LGQYTKNFLKDFVKLWKQLYPEIGLDDEQAIARIQDSLKDCLQSHCQRMLRSIVLKKVRVSSINSEINLSSIGDIQSELEICLNLPKNSLLFVNDKLVNFVEQCLK
jgi:hypothetical protein